MCLASNCTLARVNLSLRPRLEDGKASLAIKYQELQEIREACWDKQQRLGEWGAESSTVRATHVNTRAQVGSAPSNLPWGNRPAVIRSSQG